MVNLPDPEVTIRDVSPLFVVAYRAVDAGAQVARAHFEEHKIPFEPNLHACLLRAHAKPHLVAAGHEVDDYSPAKLENNGLLVSYRGYEIRILKAARGGQLPEPGSRARLDFYRQVVQLSLPWDANSEELGYVTQPNLVILWQIDRRLRLSGLLLVCPKQHEQHQDGFDVHWQVPIPDPVLGIVRPNNQIDALEGDDLDISSQDVLEMRTEHVE